MEKYWRVKILSLPYSLRATVKSPLKIFRRAAAPRVIMCKCMSQSFLSTIARVANYRCLFTRLLVDYDIPKQIMSSGPKLRQTWYRSADKLRVAASYVKFLFAIQRGAIFLFDAGYVTRREYSINKHPRLLYTCARVRAQEK